MKVCPSWHVFTLKNCLVLMVLQPDWCVRSAGFALLRLSALIGRPPSRRRRFGSLWSCPERSGAENPDMASGGPSGTDVSSYWADWCGALPRRALKWLLLTLRVPSVYHMKSCCLFYGSLSQKCSVELMFQRIECSSEL